MISSHELISLASNSIIGNTKYNFKYFVINVQIYNQKNNSNESRLYLIHNAIKF